MDQVELYEDGNMPQKSVNHHFMWNCNIGNLDGIKYYLTSIELKNHAEVHYQDDSPFILACKNNHMEVLEYLILDFKIDRTEKIDSFLKDNYNLKIEKLFEIRESKQSLENELSSAKINIDKKKIKI